MTRPPGKPGPREARAARPRAPCQSLTPGSREPSASLPGDLSRLAAPSRPSQLCQGRGRDRHSHDRTPQGCAACPGEQAQPPSGPRFSTHTAEALLPSGPAGTLPTASPARSWGQARAPEAQSCGSLTWPPGGSWQARPPLSHVPASSLLPLQGSKCPGMGTSASNRNCPVSLRGVLSGQPVGPAWSPCGI